ncbi:MAG TPA: hypothetical protein VJ302_36395 [Blastocatellia bacterium]|nr:hypothetical protein [Blastocatellia bacterium]
MESLTTLLILLALFIDLAGIWYIVWVAEGGQRRRRQKPRRR